MRDDRRATDDNGRGACAGATVLGHADIIGWASERASLAAGSALTWHPAQLFKVALRLQGQRMPRTRAAPRTRAHVAAHSRSWYGHAPLLSFSLCIYSLVRYRMVFLETTLYHCGCCR